MMTNRDIRDVPVTQQLLGYHGNKSLNLHKNVFWIVYACTKTGLKRHLVSKSHQTKYATSTASCSTITSLFNRATNRDETSSMEIKLCAFIAEHNLPLSLADDLVKP